MSRWIPRLVLAVLGLAAGFSVWNSFFLHLTPDISAYLLQARSFLETGSRYEVSFDSKGPWLTWLLAPAVWALGPTAAAAAAVQTACYLLAAIMLHRLLAPRVGRAPTLMLISVWLVLAYTPRLWGGRMRPEDVAVALNAVALYSATRFSRGGWMAGGAAVAAAFLTKTTLILAPLAVVGAAWWTDWRSGAWPRGRDRLLWAGCGAAMCAAVTLAWLLLFDDAGAWLRQTLVWPWQYTARWLGGKSIYQSAEDALGLLQRGGLSWLFCGAVAGLVVGWRRGQREVSVWLGAILVAELFRLTLERATWPYLATPLLPVLLTATALLGLRRDVGPSRWWTWLPALLLGGSLMAQTVWRQFAVFEARQIRKLPTPHEALAGQMKPLYRPGETILTTGNDVQVLLHLGAPRPYPILLHQLGFVPDEAQRAAIDHYEVHPPDWIIDADSRWSPMLYEIAGGVDDLVFAYLPATHPAARLTGGNLFQVGDLFRLHYPSPEFRHDLLSRAPYRLEVDLGCLQAWRRVGSGN
jgi:hypothetical protein